MSIPDVLEGRARWTVVHGDCLDVLPTLPERSVDVVLTDPPYSQQVHSRPIRRTYLPDVADQPCRKLRAFEFGFSHLDPEDQKRFTAEYARLAKRWVLVFSDMETAHSWRTGLVENGLEFIRYGVWIKDRAMPQITGDRPGSWVEQITMAHRRGRKKWNGGGRGNVFKHPVVVNCNGHRSDRIHTAQKPLSLIRELVELFTLPEDIVLDSHCGSSTTGVACLQFGRRYIGIDKDQACVELSRDRLTAEEQGSTLQARRAGQVAMFGGEDA